MVKSTSLYALGDFHLGMANSNIEHVKKAIEIIIKDPNDKRVYLMGDLLEVATKQAWDSIYHEDLPLEDQIDLALGLLDPIRDYIRCYCHGNHEDRLMRLLGFNVSRWISKQLGCEYAIQYFDQIPYNDNDLVVFAAHGKGYSHRPDTAISKIYRETAHVDADIIFYGHLHQATIHRYYNKSIHGLRPRIIACTGHFLTGPVNYAEKKLLPPSPPGFVKVEVSKSVKPQIIRF